MPVSLSLFAQDTNAVPTNTVPTNPVLTTAVLSNGGISGETVEAMQARELFRLGIQAFNQYNYNESLRSFEQTLALRPGEPLALEWLGRANYRSGLDGQAIDAWQNAVAAFGQSSEEGTILSSKAEFLLAKRSVRSLSSAGLSPQGIEGRYVEAGHYPGHYQTAEGKELSIFSRPTAVLPLPDSSFWLVCYGSNEIVRITANGLIIGRQRGSLTGFDRPYDMVRADDGSMYLSEYYGGRISVLDSDGIWQRYIGTKGVQKGQLSGPSYLALDSQGYIYVVEYGNNRISKFAPDGTFINTFGQDIFTSPTGIVAANGTIYVADNQKKRIETFDENGKHLGPFITGGLLAPEGLFYLDGNIIVADTSRIVKININSSIIEEIGAVGGGNVRLTNLALDANGSLLVPNFNTDEALVLSSIDEVASGFNINIGRIDTDAFPQITLQLDIKDRSGRPIVGLGDGNFLITENDTTALDQDMLYSTFSHQDLQYAVLIERSAETAMAKNNLRAALRDIYSTLGLPVSFVSASRQPFRETIPAALTAEALEKIADGSEDSYSPLWRFDIGLRLAASDLLSGNGKKALVFVSEGSLGENPFETYALSELAAYLTNNNISFYTVQTNATKIDDDIEYLCTESGGKSVYLYQSSGVGPTLNAIKDAPSGCYTLRYRSALPTNGGRAYLPVEVQAFLLERSGRDVSGYFAPLE
ncbi:MAG: 6-bladed beta-propeller [Spirochaetaceae bacterium]|nr:6-bladed beta-propeller [Spirochaetaceae bacterium]